MRFIVKVEWQEEDGTIARADLGQIDSNALQSASDVGLKLSDTKPILTQLQNKRTLLGLFSPSRPWR